MLKQLNLTGSDIDKLKAVPYSQLITAGTAALRSAAQELGRNVGWSVIADDKWLMREFCDWADTIPLIAGSVFSEMQGTLTRGDGRKNEWSQAEIDEQLTKAFGDKKDAVVAEFKQAFPAKKVQDVLYYAGGSRPGVKNLLTRKLEKGKAPVYNYVFAWEYPINGGITAFHCSELAFCFHALERAADPHRDRRRSGGDGAAGQGCAGVGELREDGQSEPARARVEAVHEGEPAGDGVRHREQVGAARRRQAGVAAAGARRPGRHAAGRPRVRTGRPRVVSHVKGRCAGSLRASANRARELGVTRRASALDRERDAVAAAEAQRRDAALHVRAASARRAASSARARRSRRSGGRARRRRR